MNALQLLIPLDGTDFSKQVLPVVRRPVQTRRLHS